MKTIYIISAPIIASFVFVLVSFAQTPPTQAPGVEKGGFSFECDGPVRSVGLTGVANCLQFTQPETPVSEIPVVETISCSSGEGESLDLVSISMQRHSYRPNNLSVEGDYAYFVSSVSTGRLIIVNISSTGSQRVAGIISESGSRIKLRGANDVFVKDNYAYVTSSGYNRFSGRIYDGALQIIDIRNPRSPRALRNIEIDGANSVYVKDNHAYVTSWNPGALQIIDISNPENPIVKGKIVNGEKGVTLLDTPRGVFVEGNHVYIVSYGSAFSSTGYHDGTLQIIDVSNKNRPIVRGSIRDGQDGAKLDRARDVYVKDNYAYVASQFSDAIQIIDVSNKNRPNAVGNITSGECDSELNGPLSVFVKDSHAYVVSRSSKSIEVFNISNLAEISRVGNLKLSFNPRYTDDFFVKDNYLYVLSDDRTANTVRLNIIEVRGPFE